MKIPWENGKGGALRPTSSSYKLKNVAFRDGEFLTEVRMVMLENCFSPANLLESTNISWTEDLLSKLFPLQFVSLLAKRKAP